jgi:iron complex transport system substrate-binding protein
VDNGDYIYNSYIRGRLQKRAIPEVGSSSTFNLERLLMANPEVVILLVLGPDNPMVDRLESVGITVLPLADWREQSPLGRAKWVKLFGELVGKPTRARRVFESRVARYRELEAMVAAESTGPRPAALINAPWQGSSPVPAGDSYVARLLEDAGRITSGRIEMVEPLSFFLYFEAVLPRGAETDVWINLNYGWTTLHDALETDPRLAQFVSFEKRECITTIGVFAPPEPMTSGSQERHALIWSSRT